jgi:MarR family transcriptional regulator, transcriptional regulator for hemolysin
MTVPITHPLLVVTKKYLSIFNGMVGDLPLDRYQYTLVVIEQHQETLSQKALSDILEVDKSYMVTIIDYLSGKGYVIREKNPADRREQLIKLTEKARKDLVQIKKAFNELNSKSLAGLNNQDIAVFKRVLATIGANLNPADPKKLIIDFKKL